MSKNMNVPKLRFSEFGGEWEEKKLGDYGKLINGLTYSPDNIIDDGLLVLRSSNIQNDQISFHDNVYVDLEVKEEYITRENDILICVRNGSKRLIGKSILISNELPRATHGAFMTVFRGDSNKLISHWFKSVIFYKEVHKNLGATINSINGSDLKKFKIILPPKQEQEKIASFLTSVDTKIEQLTKKETLLQEYKKGVMNKIFNQEIRFKDDDGSEFPEWEEKKLGDITKIIMGQSPSSDSYNLDNNGIPLIQGNADIQNRLTNPRNYTTEKTKECKVEDLILTVRAPVGAVAKSIHNACIGRGVCAIRSNKESVNEFIYQFLLNYETKWSSLEQGSTFTAVSGLEIKKLKLNLPSLKEQTKIANFLSSIDKKIELTTKELNSTKEFKKALLQQMFV